MRSQNILESEVVRCWQRQMESGHRTVTADGQPLEVLYPGRPNDCRGGDFRDAVILIGKDIKKGCIEIHSCTSGWQAHGHHVDPHYNQVVLHVVWQQDSTGNTLLEDGKSVPTIVLDRDLAAMEEEGKTLPCRGSQTPELGLFLERLGGARLAEKAERFRLDIQKMEPDQALYEGLLEALGYSKNKQPFLELARRAPLKDLKLLMEDGGDQIRVQSYLSGAAGLLPSQRGREDGSESYVRELESGWGKNGSIQPMSYRDWELYKVRPGNYPVRRIMALSKILFRFLRYGWLEAWRRVLGRAVREDSPVDLGALLRVRAEGYWLCHYDFSLSQTGGGAWLLGRERAAEIVINVILPFFTAWCRSQGETELGRGLERICRLYPPCETNSIQRHMLGQLKAEKGIVNSALRQQGLLHLYKTYCTHSRCLECLLYG